MASRTVDEVEVLAVECDELLVYEAIDEVEEEYGEEELNEIDGLPARGEFSYTSGPVIRLVTGDEADEYYWDGAALVR